MSSKRFVDLVDFFHKRLQYRLRNPQAKVFVVIQQFSLRNAQLLPDIAPFNLGGDFGADDFINTKLTCSWC